MKRALLIVIAVLLVGCSSTDAADSPSKVRADGRSHVFVIVMENKERDAVVGSPDAPYFNSLVRRYASPTHMYGVAHPSLPNYFALTAGTTFGVTTDCTDCQQSGRTIAHQLDAKHVSWKAYMGGMPQSCFKGATSGEYAKKHDPFMYYPFVADSRKRCAHVVPEKQLSRDLAAGRLPTYSFMSPGLCDDTHDCPVGDGDKYLKRVVPPVLKALGPRGFLVLTYDEGTSADHVGGRIATVIAGAAVKRGAKPGAVYNHYSTLRTIEDALRLTHLRHAGDSGVRSFGAAFKGGAVPKLR